MIRNAIATPKLLATFRSRKEMRDFNWSSLPTDGFAIKPARGYGGGGIIVFKKWEGSSGTTVSGEQVDIHYIENHLLDILDGAFSLQYLPDYAFIEERIHLHPFYKKICSVGLPDIRIIVLNAIPIMAMLRLPTEESHGTANLMQGAIALGIDMRTGITNYAYKKHGTTPRFIPGTKTKLRGLKIPKWNELLLLAAKAQQASKLGYAGIDLVHDGEKGPLVLEINARPGLSIQSANRTSLRTRLERVENMHHITPERGVEMAKSLFVSAFSEKVKTNPKTVGVIEQVVLEGERLIKAVDAKVDTGAFRTSIDKQLVSELGFPKSDKEVQVQSASGVQTRETINATFHLRGVKIKSVASVTDRSHLKYPVIIGRRDLKGFLVDPTINAPDESSDSMELDLQSEETNSELKKSRTINP